jgi:D-3-phosphoglycerate dehydrogenase / 2-oxoglutarate reductase
VGVRILITDQNFDDDARVERELIAATDHELVVTACTDEADVIQALEQYRPDLLLVQFVKVGAEALAQADTVRAIVRYGIGVDNIDIAAAAERGIAVARIPDYCIDEVADQTLALVLAVERRVLETANGTRAGEWNFRAGGPMRRLQGLSFGLLGFGRIAQAVALRAGAFGFKLLAHDVAVASEAFERLNVEAVSRDELLARSDVLSLHLPLTPETRGTLGARELARLPQGATVINTARGGLIDEPSLLDALENGHLGGAGIDVLEREPPAPGDPLRTAPRIVLTPHAAWYSEAAIVELRTKAVEAALLLLNGGVPVGQVSP